MELLKIQHEHFFERAVRIDGRKFNESRDLLINLDSIASADSSTTVKLGSTCVMCGLKVTPNEAVKSLETIGYGDLIDLKVSLYVLGEESGDRDEITSLVVKTIKENILFDHKPLISEDDDGEKQYLSLNIELICLNNDGNVFDAFIIAFLAALNALEFPEYKDICNESFYQPTPTPTKAKGKGKKKKTNSKKRLTLIRFPISITSALLPQNFILIDPNRDEEKLATGTLTFVFDVKSRKIIIMDKKGGIPIDESRLIKHLTFTQTLAEKFFKTLPFLSRDEDMET